MPFRPEKRSLKKCHKSTISKEVSPWFLSNNQTFFSFVFFGQNKSEKIVFCDILDLEKNAF